jgi:hypothetical protein
MLTTPPLCPRSCGYIARRLVDTVRTTIAKVNVDANTNCQGYFASIRGDENCIANLPKQVFRFPSSLNGVLDHNSMSEGALSCKLSLEPKRDMRSKGLPGGSIYTVLLTNEAPVQGYRGFLRR